MEERAIGELGLTETAVMVTLNKGAKLIDVGYDFVKDKYMIICKRQSIKIPVIVDYDSTGRFSKVAMVPTLLKFDMDTDEDFNYPQPLDLIVEGVEVPEFEPIYV